MKKFNITKLDRRHKGYRLFTHYIAPVWSSQLADKLEFFEWRKWCWNTWGPGMEREIVLDLDKQYWKDEDVRWAWHTQDGAKRLYFASEKELNWFVLTWSS
jgi:hypothetical protein